MRINKNGTTVSSSHWTKDRRGVLTACTGALVPSPGRLVFRCWGMFSLPGAHSAASDLIQGCTSLIWLGRK